MAKHNSRGISTDFASYNLLIRSNQIHNIGTPDGVNRGGAYGMYFHSSNTIVEDNKIYDNSGYGIHFYNYGGEGSLPSDNNTFRGNRIYNNGETGMLLSGGG